jgi:hypothetical protein
MRTPALVIGALLLVVGLFIAGGKMFYKDTDKVIDAGPLQVSATHNRQMPLNWGYILIGVGAIVLVGGAVAARKS